MEVEILLFFRDFDLHRCSPQKYCQPHYGAGNNYLGMTKASGYSKFASTLSQSMKVSSGLRETLPSTPSSPNSPLKDPAIIRDDCILTTANWES